MPKCEKCGKRAGYWAVAKDRNYIPCNCGGYSHPHKPTLSKLCHSNPLHELYSRESQGEASDAVFWDMVLGGRWPGEDKTPGDAPPF